METNFKVGDIIKNNKHIISRCYTVVDIIFGEKEYRNNGFHGVSLKDCYILYSAIYNYYSFLPFKHECFYSIVAYSVMETKIILPSSCPQCNGELVDKYSDYVGGTIKKCKACGWC